jgi:hypothetical protein
VVVADGRLLVPTYEKRVDVYELTDTPVAGPAATNAQRRRPKRREFLP